MPLLRWQGNLPYCTSPGSQRYLEWRPAVWDKGAPYIFTRDYTYDVKAVESSWRSGHAAAGNAAPSVSHLQRAAGASSLLPVSLCFSFCSPP